MFDFWRNQNNRIALTPAIEASANFSFAQKVLSDSNNILQLRIHRAKQLLLGTDLTVAEIAYRCGMDDPGYFSTLFRKATGITPVAFRTQSV